MNNKKFAFIVLLSAFNAFCFQDDLPCVAQHREWLRWMTGIERVDDEFQERLSRGACKCLKAVHIKNINQAIERKSECYSFQDRQGCFDFKTWKPACHDYYDQEIKYMAYISQQLKLCNAEQ